MNNIYLCFDRKKVNLKVFIEYAMSFGKRYSLKIAELSCIKSYTDNNLYIFIQRIPDDLLKNPIKNMVLLNIEQITTPKYSDMIKEVLSKNIKVIDYSIENIHLINKISPVTNNTIGYLPYQYEPNEVSKLETFVKHTPKMYDIAFTGWLSLRRKVIINKLKEKGFKVQLIKSKWGTNRDFMISSAKILLNIHYNESYNIYEAIRCDRWTFAGMMVVSEDSIENEELDISELVIFDKYDNLVDKVTEILNNYDEYHNKFISNHKEMIVDIKKNRTITDKDFINIITP